MAPETDRRIWMFALGYFLCYAPYSGLIKQVTGAGEGASGFSLLPSATLGTALTLPLLTTLLRQWHRPRLDRHTIISGSATGVIIVTTTLAYTFDGVSIVFALLLLRGGVLILAPLVDLLCGRDVRRFCWYALFLSILALVIALARQTDIRMSWVAILNTCAYVAAYAVRLPEMTTWAKIADKNVIQSWFCGEMSVALCVQLVLGWLGAAIFHLGAEPGKQMAIAWVGVPIGVLYGALYFFGTRVYLDRRENTFCIPLNRGASLLSGVAASSFLGKVPDLRETACLGLIVTALLVLAPFHHLDDVRDGEGERHLRRKAIHWLSLLRCRSVQT